MGRNSKGALSTDDGNGDSEFKFDPNDAKKYYCPIFCLADPPEEYFEVLAKHPVPESWLNITSSATNLDEMLSDIAKNVNETPSDPAPLPFIGKTMEHVTDFYEKYLRSPPDQTMNRFCHFVYLVVDASCFQKEPSTNHAADANTEVSTLDSTDFTILFCSDAPDVGEVEDEIRLKIFRLKLADVLDHAASCETLSRTPSEAFRFSWAPTNEAGDAIDEAGNEITGMLVRPPPTFMMTGRTPSESHIEYRIATREEARANKRRGILIMEKTEKERGGKLGRKEFASDNPENGAETNAVWGAWESCDIKVAGETVGTLPGWADRHRNKKSG